MKRAYLLLADGTLFEGYSVGYEGQSIGEVVFNTGMAGYQEVLTDPSYYGQIVTMQADAGRIPQGTEGHRPGGHRHPPAYPQAQERGRYERHHLYRRQ